MDLSALLKKYAEQIGGQYTEYDKALSIVIVPVSGGRYQTVLASIAQNELYNRQLVSLSSKICSIKPGIDYELLLEQTAYFNYCRFVIKDHHLQIEAVAPLQNLSEETVKEMVQEAANLADQFELRLTGMDIN